LTVVEFYPIVCHFARTDEETIVIKVSVFYPYKDGCKFDMTYYVEKHLPMVKKKLGAVIKGVAVEQGISGGAPGVPMTYVAMGHMLVDSVEAFQTAFTQHAQEIMADVPNYTNLQPIIQVSEVKV
jgi:uncharacterized protein (TIGR02118 family)